MEEQEPKQTESLPKPEGLLYHYTTPGGLLGIIRTKHIWATHARYLNDTSEGRIIFHVLLDKFMEVSESLGTDALMHGLNVAGWATSQHVFVASFSEEGNLLSQWVAYSGMTGGYSIGFQPDYLREIGQRFLNARVDRFYDKADPLARCNYCDDLTRKSLEKEFESQISAYSKEAVSLKGKQEDQSTEGLVNLEALAISYFVQAGRQSAIAKHEGFREEREWRLAFPLDQRLVPHDLEFRPGSSMPVPYLRVCLNPDGIPIGIRKIIVGPSPHPTEAVDAVNMLLEHEGIKGVEVVLSGIPYRNLSVHK